MTHLAALTGVMGISFAAIFVRLADVAPATATFFRSLYALPLVLVVLYVGRRRSGWHRGWAFVSGLLLAMDLTIWHVSIDLIGAGLATVLANVQVVWVGLLAWVIHRERPTGIAFATVPVVLIGVALISGLGRNDAYGDEPMRGALVGLAAGFVYSLFLLTFRHANREHAPTAGPLLDATAGATVGGLIAALFDPGFSGAVTWPAHGWLLALAVVAQTVGWLLIAVALPRLAALETSVMLLLQPAATIVWASIIFSESLSPLQWTGAVVVLGGVLVAGLRGTVRPDASGAPLMPIRGRNLRQ